MNRPFYIVSDTDFRKLKNDIVGELAIREELFSQKYLLDEDINILITKAGDIHVYQNDSFHGRDVYFLHDMGNEPWKDLAVICVAAEDIRKHGAGSVSVIVPEWKLGHHDMGMPYLKDRTGSQGLVAAMLKESSIDRLVTLTPTVDMLNDMYPVQVETPDISKLIEKDMKRSSDTLSLIVSIESDVLPLALNLSQRMGWDYALCQTRADGSHVSADVYGRDVLLYTHHISDRLSNIISMLKREHCESINCYIPWVEDEEKLSKYAEDVNFITLDRCSYSLSTPMEDILAIWILRDRQKKQEVE